jgi:hypothetical protein
MWHAESLTTIFVSGKEETMYNHRNKQHKSAMTRSISLPRDLWDFLEGYAFETHINTSMAAHILIENGQLRMREANARKRLEEEGEK